MNWFECKVSYEKTTETGVPKKVSESYLVDALSFTEAEARITKEITPFVSIGEFTISNIKRAKIAEIFESTDEMDDRYYKAKVLFITLDEKSGTEKKSPANMIVHAGSLEGAVARLREEMDKGMATYEIAAISDTTIMDIFPFENTIKE
ncbi:DUF4494 domain-containing protein [Falsiporphyromonas endometrii]|uniref:DUF4494 domain-containing protein n=1 Tax=Falsiporphyromonas endometrii TaxID=1387297 RepID=A0ABV9K7J7_9PORP